ncbi:nucleotide-binding universal stress UspA family protein [Streptosporangium album]|uniref:Nucleotide-binding universal stress UspA family protein n=1 Tax=Streptosporangium album TaxID=47479 RepID=A0A7W7S376_9ACTN|nr:universal stress protein [Streptosporangium album]MBB4942995.1 nucleotide-binding universal stress UspA family protein [Streptosporangium album]
MTKSHRIVVGYDGSDFSMQALEWALDEAEFRGLPLTVTHAWRWPYGEADDEAKLHLRKAAEHVLYHGADCARGCSTITDVATDLYEGSAGQRLIELSADAELVVVGSRGLGAVARSAVGSVTASVVAGAQCPAVVVRGAGPIPVPLHPGPVALGIRDTTADQVLDFAFHEAALRRLRLRVLHAGHPRSLTWGVAMTHLPDLDDSTRACQEWMNERLTPWQEKYADVPVDVRFTTNAPKETLRAASIGATLVVVGTGRTAYRTGHPGAVIRSLVRHASCPVAVVPSC